jgi:hypothetical protein
MSERTPWITYTLLGMWFFGSIALSLDYWRLKQRNAHLEAAGSELMMEWHKQLSTFINHEHEYWLAKDKATGSITIVRDRMPIITFPGVCTPLMDV